ncbi:unnamed protein product [Rodentolepis nana]|uniref:Rho-GAP domain-containing protein n=1 Tax=Rodentolepis nana TaxID=102285 RepID=A0A0R3TWT9_RODNA|nr:unnamed protein product [Rodentolepis nana]
MDNPKTCASLSLTQQEYLQQYIQQLEASSQNVKIIRSLRTLWFPRFLDLCKARLSEVVDPPVEFSEYNPSRYQRTKFRQFDNTDLYTEEPSRIYDAVVSLMQYISSEDLLQTPLIFRKSGNISRQRDLSKHLLNGEAVAFPFYSTTLTESSSVSILTTPTSIKQSWNRMTRSKSSKITPSKSETTIDNGGELNAHDYANVLKTVLREMPEPILTKDLLPIYISVSKLTSANENLTELDYKLVRAKQQSAIRILSWLLPMNNQHLLRSLLDLLTQTLAHSDVNSMSAESLGTIFGPLLFAPSCRSHNDLHKDYDSLNALATVMIEQGSEGVFAIPLRLFNDIKKIVNSETFLRMITSRDSGLDSCSLESSISAEDVDMYTDIAFAERCNNIESPTWKQATQDSIDQLIKKINGLPDSHPRKSYYLRALCNNSEVESESFFQKATRSFFNSCKTPSKHSATKMLLGASAVTPSNPERIKISCCPIGSVLSASKKRRVESGIKKKESVLQPENKKLRCAAVQTDLSLGSSVLLQMPVKRNYGRSKVEKVDISFPHHDNMKARHSL